MTHADIVIVGAGMVGSMLAAAAGQAGFKTLVVETQLPQRFDTNSPYDLRVSALNVASERMLHSTGAWTHLQNMRCAAFKRMKVWDGEYGGATEFNSEDLDHSHLGTIVENRVIQLALHAVIDSLSCVDIRHPASIKSFDVTPDDVRVTLDSGDVVHAALLVGADGARSSVRELAGIATRSSRYPQKALVASVDTEMPQQDITWQRFLPSGPQALLPLQGARASLVWYHDSEEIDRLLQLEDADFLQSLQQEFPSETGAITHLHQRGSFPLFASHAEHYVLERVALIGDAAHSVHPLAGQGVNLGLMDAATLFDAIAAAGDSNRDIGALSCLRRYERARRGDNELMLRVLDGFYNAFKPQPQAFGKARSAALDMAQRITPLRQQVMRHAMGVNQPQPSLAQLQTAREHYPEKG